MDLSREILQKTEKLLSIGHFVQLFVNFLKLHGGVFVVVVKTLAQAAQAEGEHKGNNSAGDHKHIDGEAHGKVKAQIPGEHGEHDQTHNINGAGNCADCGQSFSTRIHDIYLVL